PGAPAAWAEALERCGTIGLERALRPAIALAGEGVPVDLVLSDFLAGPTYAALCADFPALSGIFGPPGETPPGEILYQPALARSLEAMARDGVEAFYGGAVGAALVEDLGPGALLDTRDLAAHRTLFQTPLGVDYRGHRVLSAPPNTQGIALLLLLGGLAFARDDTEPFLARFMRIKEQAFAVRDRCLGDPALAPDLAPLCEPAPLARLAAGGAVGPPGPRSAPAGGDTTTVAAVDAEGNAVSWVQSVFEAFGSGVVSERTGIVLQNRLSLASLHPDGPNALAPGRRPFHTLCPALVLRDGACRLAVATPGDHGQPQTLAQVIVNLLDRGMNIQEAIEAPRIRHDGGTALMHESRMDPQALAPLHASGYELEDVGPWSRLMGGVNAIHILDNGVRLGGADPRRASYAIAE
ncbi:MAG: hypothetical protein GWN84_19525, partial [Gammaproteobacteria bacterium]|nr:hypothetical protein [Gammaproteobacteria bacterium]NIR85018.1 hypothetical protein [Gammaproteobacteria bacterium]NIR88285.1 hypothetical protein [Gammaproteobacteria bacterium]NIU06065.1 hypothetical protein [Gammaproteobacteria bacterium]NIV73484.1 hypothetical protein [Gammaproteobacteria bacterium]